MRVKSKTNKQKFLRPSFSLSTEAVVQRCSVKRVFLEIWQNSQENTCARVFFLRKLQAATYPLNLSSFINKSKSLSHPVGITGVAVVTVFSMEIGEGMEVLE